jgi:glucose/arabinose dehydrogenase
VPAGMAAAALLVVTGCTSEGRTSTSTPMPAPTPGRGTSPRVAVSTIESGLSFPWDLTFTPDGTMLFDERPGAIWARPPSGPRHKVAADLGDLFVGGESGLMGMVVDPDFTANRRFYTCQAYRGAGTDPIDIRVIRWTINDDYTAATRDGAPVVTGLPITSGRHGGCRLRFAPDGTLHIGTGDAATATNPQNLQSLGGKTLRVRPDGSAPTDNPFYAMGGDARYVYTYGHRNVQGLALQPGTGLMWTVEHGPDRDDEVNVEQKGGNYGWNPVPGYNESVPMTDTKKYPHAIEARWSSGLPTIAPSGGAFITGARWGSYQGVLAVGVLKDTGLLLLTVNSAGTVTKTARMAGVEDTYGRLRAPQMGPGDVLYVTTSNGEDQDKILRIVPTGT